MGNLLKILHAECVLWTYFPYPSCIHIEPAVEESVYELIVGSQEQPEQAQEVNCEDPTQIQAEINPEHQEGKPQSITHVFKSLQYYLLFIIYLH